MIVIDASVFVKLLKIEVESDLARAFIDSVLDTGTHAIAPALVLYETLSAALHVGYSFGNVHEFYDRLGVLGLEIIDPSRDDLLLAESIATTEAPAGGYPTLFDAIYHAMAITRNGTFLTADRRHHAKTQSFGHCQLLADWKPA